MSPTLAPARPARPAPPKIPARTPRRPAPGRKAVRSAAARRTALSRRVRFLRLGLVVALVIVAARLVDVQVVHSGQYQRQARQEVTQKVTVPALRGTITDRNGVVLVTSVPTDEVIADDFQIRHPATEAKALAPLLGLSAATLQPLLSERNGYVPLVQHLSTARAKRVSNLAFPGITMMGNSVTETPDGTLAAPIVGGVNAAGAGDAGLESQYNSRLSGRPGQETLLESPIGVQLPGTSVAEKSSPAAGTGLQLTIDAPLQYTAEQDLAQEIVASHAKSGTAVVMDVQTGQILAMANLVASTPAGPPGSPPQAGTSGGGAGNGGTPVTIGPGGPVQEAPTNLAVTHLYEPGSVFKIVTFSAALADGVITPTTTYTVPDTRTIDGYLFHDATPHPTQPMTATQIIAQSSNIGTSFIAQGLGETRLLAQVKELGFGSPTGLHFPGDSPGLIVTRNQWSTTDYVSLAIGQTDAVSPLQVLDAFNAEANGGVFVTPKLVRATIAPSGAVDATAPSATRRVMPAPVAKELATMMETVVNNGTGVAASVPGYLIAGKTGTAQIPYTNGQVGYITGAFDATFVGFAPANHPVLSAIVELDRPTPIYGGAVAAPVFSKIMAYALHRYDVPTTPGLNGKAQANVPLTQTQLVKAAT